MWKNSTGIFLACFLCASVCLAQPPGTETPSAKSSQVIIKRKPLQLVDPKKYQVTLHLKPIRQIDITPLRAGSVETVQVKPNDQLQAQEVVVQMRRQTELLELKIAKLELESARLVVKQAGTASNAAVAVSLAESQLKTAEAKVELAEHRVEETLLRAPYPAKVFRVTAVPGQYVQPGESLLTVADVSAFTVEIPVDRSSATVGKTIPVRVENQTIQAEIQAVLPLGKSFESLRELFPSIASATVILKNDGGSINAGQTVYSDLIPRDPVTEVPNETLQNLTGNHPPDHRFVQVIRDLVVRDVTVKLLGQIGSDRTFVTGTFQQGDEIITSTSQPLKDGTQVRPGVPPARGKGAQPGKPGETPQRPDF